MSVMPSFSDKFENVTHLFERFWYMHGNVVKVVGAVVCVGLAVRGVKKAIEYKNKRAQWEWSKAHPDVVILHQFPRGTFTPSISPFPMKLETYLRLAKITHRNDFKGYWSSKGKTPYITVNGEDIADSQLCIEYLNEKYQVNLNSGYSDVEVAVGQAFRLMAENSFYWALALDRWVYSRGRNVNTIFPQKCTSILTVVFGCLIKKAAYHHGIGRHSEEEVRRMASKELEAISVYLGSKQFFLGDKPCEVDCALFGLLAQAVWNSPGSFLEKLVKEDFPNLHSYCLRMKETVWPDWDKCLAQGTK